MQIIVITMLDIKIIPNVIYKTLLDLNNLSTISYGYKEIVYISWKTNRQDAQFLTLTNDAFFSSNKPRVEDPLMAVKRIICRHPTG